MEVSMINKQNLWFLTLFCLILVLGVYYVALPNDLLEKANKAVNKVHPIVVIKAPIVVSFPLILTEGAII